MHGMPVAPYKSKSNSGSGFIAFRLGVLTVRKDSVTSNGIISGIGSVGKPAALFAGDGDGPLKVGVASVECCTSGLFFKGFPRVIWLQVGRQSLR
jgi:hypothetical protein